MGHNTAKGSSLAFISSVAGISGFKEGSNLGEQKGLIANQVKKGVTFADGFHFLSNLFKKQNKTLS